MSDSHQKYCVIGAGPSGLTAAKNLRQAGILFDCYEGQDDVGGNWYYGSEASSVYESTHLISSKRMTEYTDYPMPSEYPPYPDHRQVLEYLRSYARAFELYGSIAFSHVVQNVAKSQAGWEVTVQDKQSGDSETKSYRGVVVANGHHWDPFLPDVDGKFDGQLLHSHDYKSPEVLRDKRVLVVGGGNSGCDIAVEAALNAKLTSHSMRRGYHFVPKFLFGKPADRLGDSLYRWHVPRFLRRLLTGLMVRVAVGPARRYGLTAPTHRLFETHPIINSQLLYHVGHGSIQVRPDVEKFEGHTVHFSDGTKDEFDLVIFATGVSCDVSVLR